MIRGHDLAPASLPSPSSSFILLWPRLWFPSAADTYPMLTPTSDPSLLVVLCLEHTLQTSTRLILSLTSGVCSSATYSERSFLPTLSNRVFCSPSPSSPDQCLLPPIIYHLALGTASSHITLLVCVFTLHLPH